jgi:3-dehydroquinate dehydratase-2
MKPKILVLHGPNLNLLGEREPHIYGKMTLRQLNQRLRTAAARWSVQLKIHQSNSEGTLIDLLHTHRKWATGIVFNPGAFTHYSYALRDAVASISIPTVEVHLSDPVARALQDSGESFRKVSVIAPVCLYQVAGKGWKSYLEAIQYLCRPEGK